MNNNYNPKLVERSRELRRDMTKEERKLWYTFLRFLPVKFVRQKVIAYYIADFYCAEAKLVIELDGSQHFDEEGEKYDERRDRFLSDRGLTVLRYTNREIAESFEGVKADILLHLESSAKGR